MKRKWWKCCIVYWRGRRTLKKILIRALYLLLGFLCVYFMYSYKYHPLQPQRWLDHMLNTTQTSSLRFHPQHPYQQPHHTPPYHTQSSPKSQLQSSAHSQPQPVKKLQNQLAYESTQYQTQNQSNLEPHPYPQLESQPQGLQPQPSQPQSQQPQPQPQPPQLELPEIQRSCIEPELRDGVLEWKWGTIEGGHPRWQRADNLSEVFVYSAHYDDIESPPLIRVVGLALDPLPYSKVTCRFFGHHGGPEVRKVVGDVMHSRKSNKRRYLAAFIECSLKRGDNFFPYAVSLSKGDNSSCLNYLVVHYSQRDMPNLNMNMNNTSNQGRQPILMNYSADFGHTNDDDNDTGEGLTDETRKTEGVGFAWNVTRCFPALQANYDDDVMLGEMVALSRLQGVDRFVFYLQSAGPRVLAMLKVLESEGDTQVLHWNLHMNGSEVHYSAQFSAVNDCLYRHLRSSRYVLFGDVDELFVPRNHSNLPSLLHRQFAKKPQCGAFLFLHAFFRVNLSTTDTSKSSGDTNTASESTNRSAYTSKSTGENKTLNAAKTKILNLNFGFGEMTVEYNNRVEQLREALQSHNNMNNNNNKSCLTYKMLNNTDNTNHNHNHNNNNNNNSCPIYKMLNNRQRHGPILPPQYRSKPAVDPRRVFAGSVHVVEKMRPGFASCVMDPNLALLHHYRECTPDKLQDILNSACKPGVKITTDLSLGELYRPAQEMVETLLEKSREIIY